MSHLSLERIAALSDDTPTPIEAAHITTCETCTRELTAQRRLVRWAAGEQMARLREPISNFDALLPRLRAEGLVAARDRMAQVRVWSVRVAAGLVLMASGAIVGRRTAGSSELPTLPKGGSGDTAAVAALTTAGFRSSDDAIRAMNAAQQTYQTAAAFLAAQDTTSHFIGLNQSTYRTRLAALDEIAAATRVALYRAPQDPVLNQYYLGTLSEREATLTQLRQAIPATSRIRSY